MYYLKCLAWNKNIRYRKKYKNVTSNHEIEATKRNRSQGTQMLESADTAFKLAVVSIF